MGKESLRIHCSNGHLGFAPTKEESFGLVQKPCLTIIAVTQAATTSARYRWG